MSASTYLDQALKRFSEALASGWMGEDTVLAVFAAFRQHFEVAPGGTARTVKHYANWMLHSRLEQSASALLDEADGMLHPTQGGDPNQRIIEILRFKELRRELMALLAGHPAVATFESFSAWHNFLSVVLRLVAGKPLARKANFKALGEYVDWLELHGADPEAEDPDVVRALKLQQGSSSGRSTSCRRTAMPWACSATSNLGRRSAVTNPVAEVSRSDLSGRAGRNLRSRR